MRILVIGAGAVGGYFGARLAAASADVTFQVRSGRRDQLLATGLRVTSAYGSLAIRPSLIDEAEAARPFDLVILACKAYDLATALRTVKERVSPQGRLLPLLNGIAHLDELKKQVGAAQVLGGLAHIGSKLDPDGTIIHLNRIHELRFGTLAGGSDAVCEQLASALAATPVQAAYSHEIVNEMWEKYVFLATLAGATCLMRAPLNRIHSTTHGSRLVAALFEEASAVAAAEGYRENRGDRLAAYRAQVMEAGSPSTASMLRDIQRSARTENDHVLGWLVHRAAEHGIEVPYLGLAYSHVACYEDELTSK